MSYFSQYNQDKFLDKVIFNKKRKGYFVDIGAYDGLTISNTCFFEKQREWKGICFEPNPSVFSSLSKNRDCELFNCCIGTSNQNPIFFQVVGGSEMLSGLKLAYDPRHLERIFRETNKNNGSINEILVEIKSLVDFLPEGKVVDYLSIDTEGNEIEILKSIDFNRNQINSISIENNYNDLEIKNILLELGYNLVVKLKCDEIYVHKSIINFAMNLRIIFWKIKNRILLHRKGLSKRINKFVGADKN